MGKHWRIFSHDEDRIARLEKTAEIPAIVAQLLVCRGILDPRDARQFLDAKLANLRDPELLPGLKHAADRIHAAIQSGRRITIYGDYDADGMTATAILWRCLRLLDADVDFYVPHRLDEGYGLNDAALTKLAEKGRQLIVTVDCGITSSAEAATAQRLGLELIITDHHELTGDLPAAASIVHPGLDDGIYPFRGLCGAGIAFKLAWAVCQRASQAKRVQPRLRNYLLDAIGLAAIGTVADVVPLLDENRLIVRHGLYSLKNQPMVGIAALCKVTGLDKKPTLNSEDIAFMLAPRLNAAGRLGQAELAVELMITDSPERAEQLAAYVHELNGDRDSLERGIYLAAQKQAKEEFDIENDPALVLAGRGWHPGVIGIVAGRLAEKYCRPVVMIALDKLGANVATGSARSAFGLNLYDALHACGEHLTTFGGHAAAAGLRIDEAHIEPFRNHFCDHVNRQVAPELRTAELCIDAETTLPQLTLRTINQIEQLAPFGQDNPRPLLFASRVQVDGNLRRVGGGERHLLLSLRQFDRTFRAIAFGQAERAKSLEGDRSEFDIAFRPIINEFRGRRSVELQLVDWRRSQS